MIVLDRTRLIGRLLFLSVQKLRSYRATVAANCDATSINSVISVKWRVPYHRQLRCNQLRQNLFKDSDWHFAVSLTAISDTGFRFANGTGLHGCGVDCSAIINIAISV
jgi:hypothetical protein